MIDFTATPHVYGVKLCALVNSDSRPIDDDAVERLADSMKTLGVSSPIMVRRVAGEIHVVFGQHRVEAARRLDWDNIPAMFVKGTDLENELRQIDENLVRHDLSAMEKTQQLARRVEIVSALAEVGENNASNPRENPDAPRKRGRGRPKGKVQEVAAATGTTPREVQKAVRRTRRIAPAVQKRLTESRAPADALDALADLDHIEQGEVVDRMEKNGETARKAIETVAPGKAKPKRSTTAADAVFAGIRVRTRAKAETPELIAIKAAWTDATDADRAAFDEWRAGAGR